MRALLRRLDVSALALCVLLASSLLFGACTVDDAHPGPRCDTSESCPAGRTCYRGFCVLSGGGPDSGSVDSGAVDSGAVDGGGCPRACESYEVCCGGSCIMRDADNCGFCGDRCTGGRSCCDSMCTDLQTDAENCGMCGRSCMACVLGMCTG